MQAGHHTNKEQSFILLYSSHHDVSVAFPRSCREDARHIAHASYCLNGNKGISVYSFPSSKMMDLEKITLSRSLQYKPMNPTKRDKLLDIYSIRAKIVKDAPPGTLDIIARDVEDFSKDKNKPKQNLGTSIEIVDKIIPQTEPGFWGEIEVDKFGKQVYVPTCLFDVNIDSFNSSCSALLVNGYYDPFARCDYCYAKGQHKDTPNKRMRKADKKNIVDQIEKIRLERAEQGKPTEYVRLGKVSESGSKLVREQLIIILEACIEANVSPIFPTKFLEFDEYVAELLKKSNGALLYSLGSDELEYGACENGCTNEFRLEQARLYHEYGVNTGLYPLVESLNYDNPFFKDSLEKALEMHKSIGMPVQLLSIRPVGKKQLEQIVGVPYKDLLVTGQHNLFGGGKTPGGYIKTNSNEYAATRMDDRFKGLLDQGSGMCHHNPQTTWCGGCLQQEPRELKTEKVFPERFKRHKRQPKKGRARVFKFEDG